jgi:azurin
MKKHLILPLLATGLVLAFGGQKAQAAAATFELTANDTMKFNLTRLEVKAGQEVKITLTNVGTMPKAAMGHNLVVLKKGADAKAYADAAVTAAATEYIPAALADQVIAKTKLLGPKQSQEITFKAPAVAGEYPFLCTFPAHFLSGMKGVLVVN